MNFRQFQVVLALLSTTSVFSFSITPVKHQRLHYMAHDMEASTSANANVDIADVLAQANELESTIQETTTSTDLTIANDGEQDDEESSLKGKAAAAALAGSALGVVAGSPLVVGAALGYAGTQIFDNEKNRDIAKNVGKGIGEKLSDAYEYAKSEIEKEEDPSKIPEKVLAVAKLRASQGVDGAKAAPSALASMFKEKLENGELKQAPGRAFSAIKGFIESDEVKKASSSAMKALKDSIESDEMQALKNRASQAMSDTLSKKE